MFIFKGDRFIPNRSATNVDLATFLLGSSSHQKTANEINRNADVSNFQQIIADSFLNLQNSLQKSAKNDANTSLMEIESSQSSQKSRIFSFKNKQKPIFNLVDSLNLNLSSYNLSSNDIPFPKIRNIPQAPEKILDAPEILDDYYLNLMDWGSNGLLAVSLNQSVYLWNCHSGEISNLLTTECPNNYICSVSWMNQGGNCLAVGFADDTVQLMDATTGQALRNLRGHTSRVSALSWNNHVLSSAGRDTWILNHDIRAKNNVICAFEGHKQEVCGLKWSPDGRFLASGGNDNNLFIWDLASSSRRKNYKQCFSQHTAAVKALSWCPFQRNLLVSGGGTADKTMKFWDVETGRLINNVPVESQVCSILWNPFEKEILSSHGFSKNQLILWKYPTMEKVTELNGHTNRVLHMSLSPNGTTVVSAAADETLRFWKVFDAPCLEEKNSITGFLQENSCNLR